MKSIKQYYESGNNKIWLYQIVNYLTVLFYLLLFYLLFFGGQCFGQFKFQKSLPDRYTKFYWNCEQSTPVDLSYSARTMTNTGSVINSNGMFGRSFYIAGTSKVELDNYNDFTWNNDFTIEFWFKDVGGTNSAAIFNTLDGTSPPYALAIQYNTSGNLTCGLSTQTGGWDVVTYTTSMGTWSTTQFDHFVLQKSGNDYTTFKNGVQIAKVTSSATVGTNRAAKIGVYGYSNSIYMAGYLDDFRISIGAARYPYGTNGITYFNAYKKY